MDRKEIDCETVDWNLVAQGSSQWPFLVNTVIKLKIQNIS